MKRQKATQRPSGRQVQNGEPLSSALLQPAQKQFRFEPWNAEPDWKEVGLYSFEKGSALVAPQFPSCAPIYRLD